MPNDMPTKLGTRIWSVLKTLLTLPFNLIETIPPRDLTVTRIRITEIRIRAYWNAHGHLPERLEDLEPLKNRDNATTDGWGRPIQYAVTAPSTVTLTSLGDEGAARDDGLNQIIQVTFQADESDGNGTDSAVID